MEGTIGYQWLMPVIVATTWEAETGRIVVEVSLGKYFMRLLSPK
jgi:hypothetical protein